LLRLNAKEISQLLNIGTRSVETARTVIRKGAPELVNAVDQGKLSVSQGAIAARLSPEKQEAIAQEVDAGRGNIVRTTIKREARAIREAELGEKIAAGNLALPKERYGIILADWPRKPWAYSDETGVDRSPANHYPVQDFGWAIDVLAPMIRKLAAPDCMLSFWSTAASLVDDLEIMAEAGFVTLRPRGDDGRLLRDARGLIVPAASGTYRSHLIWDKQAIGLGYLVARPSRDTLDRRARQFPGTGARYAKPFHFQRAQGRAFGKAGLRCC
jgi:hypothetical protein